jgi:hypothetical protein
LHYGWYSYDIVNSSQVNKNKPSDIDDKFDPNFTLHEKINLEEHLSETKMIQHEVVTGLGLTIDSAGSIILAEWLNNKINGRYYIFTPSNSMMENKTNGSEGVCFYGHMKNNVLEGENYLLNINGVYAKGYFTQGKANGSFYLIYDKNDKSKSNLKANNSESQ